MGIGRHNDRLGRRRQSFLRRDREIGARRQRSSGSGRDHSDEKGARLDEHDGTCIRGAFKRDNPARGFGERPVTATPGPRNDLTDVAGLRVGCAADARVRTGVTVVLPDQPAVCAVSVQGGGPGTRESDVLRAGNLVQSVDAITLSGGSVYGLAAADGVAAALGAAGRGFQLRDAPGVPRSPIVPGAILYDLANGGDKAWGDAPPYRALGQAALGAAAHGVPLGNAGAGFGAAAGALKGGQGSVSICTADGVTVAALVCVNAFGSVTMPGGKAF
ncbi:MAG: hypothetical protein GC206_02980, partial [Alphaproteobacteria bacterium]|nr:hypothetical protein [Alphaproteobacteria bacterium]